MAMSASIYLFVLVIHDSAAKSNDVNGEFCLDRPFAFANEGNKCHFSREFVDVFFNHTYGQCRNKCKVHINDLYGDTYSLRGVNVTFVSKTTTFDICLQPTKNFERYMNINCSSWKNGEYAIFEAHHVCRESNAYCSSIVNTCICHCLNGYIAVGRHCLKANVTLGSACVADQQCKGSPFSGVCSDGYCKCQRGYILIQDQCFPGNLSLGESCRFTQQCAQPNTVCPQERCQCIVGFSEFNSAYCLKGSISVNKQCSYNKQCLGFPNAVCIEGNCTCIQGYTTEANGHCRKQNSGLKVTRGTCFEIYTNYTHNHDGAAVDLSMTSEVFGTARASDHERSINSPRSSGVSIAKNKKLVLGNVPTNIPISKPSTPFKQQVDRTATKLVEVYSHLNKKDESCNDMIYDNSCITHLNDYDDITESTQSQNADMDVYSVAS
ncbi:uncharacterized protein LOC111105918 isoform X2 [Crassostrea virginica]